MLRPQNERQAWEHERREELPAQLAAYQQDLATGPADKTQHERLEWQIRRAEKRLAEIQARLALTNRAMLQGFFDAGERKRVYYTAGYIAFPQSWKLFNTKWRRLIGRNHLPYFHMTDYVARQDLYSNWSDEKRKAVMKRIVLIASETPRLGVGSALLLDDYARLSPEDSALIPAPYGLCLSTCLSMTARILAKRGVRHSINYVFEKGDTGQGTTKSILEELFAIPGNRRKFAFHALSFARKEEYPGLQLADVLAWETGRFIPKVLGWDKEPERRSFLGLRKGNEHSAMLWDYEKLVDLAQQRRLIEARQTLRLNGRWRKPEGAASTGRPIV